MIQYFLLDALDTAHWLKQIADNTSFNSWVPAKTALVASVISAIFAIISALFAFLTYKSQKKTERNTGLLEISHQRLLLFEMIRHLYRNMVVSYSIGVKMKAKNFMIYPSEEHLKKMQVELSDIHQNLLYRDNKRSLFHKNENETEINYNFLELSKFYVELRNYNIELDIISNHFRNPNIDIETKERDLRTLCFKCNYLSRRIIDIIAVLNEELVNGVYQTAYNIISKEIDEKNNIPGQVYADSFDPYQNEHSFYARLFNDDSDRFFNGFNENVRHECGLNSEGAEKIHMIALHNEENVN